MIALRTNKRRFAIARAEIERIPNSRSRRIDANIVKRKWVIGLQCRYVTYIEVLFGICSNSLCVDRPAFFDLYP